MGCWIHLLIECVRAITASLLGLWWIGTTSLRTYDVRGAEQPIMERWSAPKVGTKHRKKTVKPRQVANNSTRVEIWPKVGTMLRWPTGWPDLTRTQNQPLPVPLFDENCKGVPFFGDRPKTNNKFTRPRKIRLLGNHLCLVFYYIALV